MKGMDPFLRYKKKMGRFLNIEVSKQAANALAMSRQMLLDNPEEDSHSETEMWKY